MKLNRVIEADDESLLLTASRDELFLIAASINEAIEAVEEWEFPIRLPGSKADATALLNELLRLLEQLPPNQPGAPNAGSS